MLNCFQEKYARYYDLIYKDKDYSQECDYLEEIFKKFLKTWPKTILDLACGTGGHAIPLSKRGYDIVGVDTSKAMIKIARSKIDKNCQKVKFYVDRMQDFNINKKFDVVILMFSAIDYLTEYSDLKKLLFNVGRYLKKSGLFVFDFWNGFTVIDHYALRKSKIVKVGDLTIKRISLSTLDLFRHLVRVKFRCTVFRKNRLIDTMVEEHLVRFFFPEEIKDTLSYFGFNIYAMYPFLTFRKNLSIENWNITVIAQLQN